MNEFDGSIDGIASGNQTWQAGQSTISWGFNGTIVEQNGGFSNTQCLIARYLTYNIHIIYHSLSCISLFIRLYTSMDIVSNLYMNGFS